MNKLVIITFLLMSNLAFADSFMTETYGPIQRTTKETLQDLRESFCKMAPQLAQRAYGQVIFSTSACLEGQPEIRKKGADRYFVLDNVKLYYGQTDSTITIVGSLDSKNRHGNFIILGLGE